ncbi:hypothetical protein KUCAC02_015250 [Chaenocephalus aceratus]|uniref:Uncharacterized protein n=1 Tax=Chaenocephalus aceratus TaxID=36190 RepID=A0ACB9XWY1_CHAAC|nr:hypothetical protein KUCAC02_015250 [Chaenocephalus aceratus]
MPAAPPATAFPHPQRFTCRAQPETPESSEPPHLGAPALAPECTGTAPLADTSGTTWRHVDQWRSKYLNMN